MLACSYRQEELEEIGKDDPVKLRRILSLQAIEREAIKENFLEFLKFVKIIDPPTQNNPGGVIPLSMWPHLIHVAGLFLSERLISIMKSRQVGLSWFVAIFCVWYALTHKGANIMLFSKGEDEAIELRRKCRAIYGELPFFLKYKLGQDSLKEITFPALRSTIKAFAATETAGISFTASIVVADEHEEHPYAKENYLSAKPTIDAGGQFISIFTVNKKKPDTLAKALFRGAENKANGFARYFIPYWERPGRDEKWYQDTLKSIPAVELEGLTPELYMQQNYPRSIEEALSSPESITVFDGKVLDSMMGDVKNPVEIKDTEIDPKVCNIYKDYSIGDYYIAATDTAHGVGRDFSVTGIMNVKTGEMVADIMDQRLPPEELAYHSVKLLGRYRNPLWYIESNDYGGVTISTAERLGYKNFGYQDDKKLKIGFNTNSFLVEGTRRGSRVELWGNLIPAINNRQIVIYNKKGILQFYDIIRNVKNQGKIEALAGRHDDYPMMVGICWLKRGEVQTSPFDLKPIHSLSYEHPLGDLYERIQAIGR